jgi:hypothetical protein
MNVSVPDSTLICGVGLFCGILVSRLNPRPWVTVICNLSAPAAIVAAILSPGVPLWLIYALFSFAIGVLVATLMWQLSVELQSWSRSLRAGITTVRRSVKGWRAQDASVGHQLITAQTVSAMAKGTAVAARLWLRGKLPLAFLVIGAWVTAKLALSALDLWYGIGYLVILAVGGAVVFPIFMRIEFWADPASYDPELINAPITAPAPGKMSTTTPDAGSPRSDRSLYVCARAERATTLSEPVRSRATDDPAWRRAMDRMLFEHPSREPITHRRRRPRYLRRHRQHERGALVSDPAIMFGGSDVLEVALARLDADIAAADAFNAEHLNGREVGDRDLVRALNHRSQLRIIAGRHDEASADFERVEAILEREIRPSGDTTMPAVFTPQMMVVALNQVPDPDAVPSEVWSDNVPMLRRARFDPEVRRDPGVWLMVTFAALGLVAGGHPKRGLRELRRVCRHHAARYGRADPVTLFARTTLAHAHLALARAPSDYVGGQHRQARHREKAEHELLALSADHLRLLGPGHPYTVYAHALLCSLLEWFHRDRFALRVTAIAVVLADVGRHRLADTRNRSGWRDANDELLASALRQSSLQQERAILVELMELARSQGLPAPAPSAIVAIGTDKPDDDQERHETSDPLRAEIPVLSGARIAIAGSSQLAAIDAVRAARTDAPPGLAPAASNEAIELMEWAQAVSGDDAPWVWGWWNVEGEHFAYIARSTGGNGDVEVLHDRAWSTLAADTAPSALSTYAAAMPAENEPLGAFVTRSDLTRSIRSERELFTRLGQEIVPPPIRTEVLRRIASGEPALPLVVLPAPESSRLPLAALAVGDPSNLADTVPTADGARDPRRLVEGAKICLAPGVQFTAAVRRRFGERWHSPDTNPAVRAIVARQAGRENFLPWAAESVPAEAHHLADAAGASLVAIVEQLASVAAGTAGVLQFSGHAVAGRPDAPGAAHLVLDGGVDDPRERLYAGDLLSGRFPRIGFPRNVVLAACSTWGDQGAADWLGLAPGLMWNGAQHVVATLWPVLDSRDAAEQHAKLVERLAADNHLASPADVIREFQLTELARQRATFPPHPRYRLTPEDLDGFASGFSWASYTVVTAGATPK